MKGKLQGLRGSTYRGKSDKPQQKTKKRKLFILVALLLNVAVFLTFLPSGLFAKPEEPKDGSKSPDLEVMAALPIITDPDLFLTQDIFYDAFSVDTSTLVTDPHNIVTLKTFLNIGDPKLLDEMVVKVDFSGKDFGSVKNVSVKIIDKGVETPVNASLYHVVGNEIIFDFSGATDAERGSVYLVEHTVETVAPAVDHVIRDLYVRAETDVAALYGGGTEIANSVVSIDNKISSLQSITESNPGLKGDSILKSAKWEANPVPGKPPILVYKWGLTDMAFEDGSRMDLVVEGGDYFVFKIYAKDVKIYNDVVGVVTNQDKSEVGTFFLDMVDDLPEPPGDDDVVAYVMIVFDDRVNNLGTESGSLLVETISRSEVKPGDDVESDLNEETEHEQEKGGDKLVVEKTGRFVDTDNTSIEWVVRINGDDPSTSDFEVPVTLKNLEITDTPIIGSDPWGFSTAKPVVEVSATGEDGTWTTLVLGEHYTMPTDTVGKNVILFSGGTDETYSDFAGFVKVTYFATVQKELGDISGNDGGLQAYDNGVTATTDTRLGKAEASITRENMHVNKDQGVYHDGEITWRIQYNHDGLSIPEAVAYFTDTPTAQIKMQGSSNYQKANLVAPPTGQIAVYPKGSNTPIPAAMYTCVETTPGVFKITFDDMVDGTDDGFVTGAYDVIFRMRLDIDTEDLSFVQGVMVENKIETGDGWSGETSNVNDAGDIIIKNAISSVIGDDHSIEWETIVNKNKNVITTANSYYVYDVLPDNQLMDTTSYLLYADLNDNGKLDLPEEQLVLGKHYRLIDFPTSGPIYDKLLTAAHGNRMPTDTNAYFAGFAFEILLGDTVSVKGTPYEFTDQKTVYIHYSSIADPEKLAQERPSTTSSATARNFAFLYLLEGRAFSDDAQVEIGSEYLNNIRKSAPSGSYKEKFVVWSTTFNYYKEDLLGSYFTDSLTRGLDERYAVMDRAVQFVTEDDITVLDADTGTPLLLGTDYTLLITSVDEGGYTHPQVRIDFIKSMKKTITVNIVSALGTDMGVIGYRYYNTAYFWKDENSRIQASASRSFTDAKVSISKEGTTVGTYLSYSVLMNKEEQLVEQAVMMDNLGRNPGQQNRVLHLAYKEGDPDKGYDLTVYPGIYNGSKWVPDKSNPMVEGTDYSFYYELTPESPAPSTIIGEDALTKYYGFEITFTEDITSAVFVEYTCTAIGLRPGELLKNKATLRGLHVDVSDPEETFFDVTNASGDSDLNKYRLTLTKVDENGSPLRGARFYLWDYQRAYILRTVVSDEHGIVTLDDMSSGSYYLQEVDPPPRYSSPIAEKSSAALIVVSMSKTTIQWPDGHKDTYNHSTEIENPYNPEIPMFEYRITIENVFIEVGSFEIVKRDYASKLPLENVVFILWRGGSESDRRYYSIDDTDPADPRPIWTIFPDEAAKISTDIHGKLRVDDLEPGRYYLEEIETIEGYEIPPADRAITAIDVVENVVVGPVEQANSDIYNLFTELKVVKTWEQGTPEADSVRIQLYKRYEGEDLSQAVPVTAAERSDNVVTLNTDNQWNYTWQDLKRYAADQRIILYSVKEISLTIHGSSISVENSLYIPTVVVSTDERIHEVKNRRIALRFEAAKLMAEPGNTEQTFTFVLYAMTPTQTPVAYGSVTIPANSSDAEIPVVFYKTAEDRAAAQNPIAETAWTEILKLGTEYMLEEDQSGGHAARYQVFAAAGTLLPALPQNTNRFTVTAEKTDYSVKVLIVNTELTGRVQIEKVDAATTNTKLEGAVFALTKLGNIPSQPILLKTDRNGFAEALDLQYGATYELKEIENPQGYSGTFSQTFTVKGENLSFSYRALNVKNTEVRGVKTWTDMDNKNKTRPAIITVNLLQNGKEISELIVSDATDWNYVFSDLPVFDENGAPYVYEITEDPVKQYTTKKEGYNLINEWIPTTKTGEDAIPWEYYLIAGIATAAAVLCIVLVVRRRRKDDK